MEEKKPSARKQQPGRARTGGSRPFMESVVLTKKRFSQPRPRMAGDKGEHGDRPVRWDSKGYAAIPFGPRGAGEWVTSPVGIQNYNLNDLFFNLNIIPYPFLFYLPPHAPHPLITRPYQAK